MIDHSSVTHVFYNNERYKVLGYITERRINGDTWYDIVPVHSPNQTAKRVNAKLCTPFIPAEIDLKPIDFMAFDSNFKGYEFGEMKTKPDEITEEMIDEAISKSVIYQEAIKALREQVAYGLRKYPEPLNYKTWDFKESIKHALSENSDKQHYLTMMLINAEFLMHIDEVINLLFVAYHNENPTKTLHRIIYDLQQKQQELETKFSPTRPID